MWSIAQNSKSAGYETHTFASQNMLPNIRVSQASKSFKNDYTSQSPSDVLGMSVANQAKLNIALVSQGGGMPDDFSANSLGTPFALGDTDKDFVYTPVHPCRIIDTRNAGGKIPTNSFRNFYVYGSGATMSAQGGNPTGCSSPRGEPRAVHMNIVAVNSNAGGWLTVWPKGTTRPLAGVLNYHPTDKTDPISNAFTVKTGFNVGQDISVFARQTTHIVADVMGYYHEAEVDPNFRLVQRNDWLQAANTSMTGKVTCPSGYYVVGGGWNSVRNEAPQYHDRTIHAYYNMPSGQGWEVGIRNDSGYFHWATVYAICLKLPY